MKKETLVVASRRLTSYLLIGFAVSIISACGDDTCSKHVPYCIPGDFSVADAAPGLAMYERTVQADGAVTKDYVIVIDLRAGASLQLFHGPTLTKSDNPLILRQSLRSAWNRFRSDQDNAFCLSNGTFFDNDILHQLLTTLAYPLKVNGQMVTHGYPSGNDPACSGCKKMMLHMWDTRAEITEYDASWFCDEPSSLCAPNIVVGNGKNANRSASESVGRTYVGVGNSGDGAFHDTILLLSTNRATDQEAWEILERDFCVSQSMMLDGGGSAQLICSLDPDRPLIRSSDPIPRTVPQMLAVLAGSDG